MVHMNTRIAAILFAVPLICSAHSDYQDRVEAAWTGQIIAALAGFQFEGKPASTVWVERFPKLYDSAPVDDDYYYELVALRAFEKYGIGLTAEQLGKQWAENNAGTWGSSEQARLLLARGIKAPETGHPRYNRLWWTIGPQFSADIYGMLAPGMPNLAGRLAREYGHVNGYAEGTDGAVFVAGMVSLGFVEKDPHEIVRKAARLIHPSSPYRQCLDEVIAMAEGGKSPEEIAQHVEDRWHTEYAVVNNAVANGGIVAASVWFGQGDYLKTVNLVFRLADFADTDCNAANAGAVTGAMNGMKGLPTAMVDALHDRIQGGDMGGVKLTPPVDERISDIARRTVLIGEKLVAAQGAVMRSGEVVTQAAERFKLGDLMRYWNPDWTLERAAFRGSHGATYLDGGTLATYPADQVRGLVLRRTVKLGNAPMLHLRVGADPGRAWECAVYANNRRIVSTLVDSESSDIPADLKDFAGQEVALRIYQLVSVPKDNPGTAYWRSILLE
jgi:hypothetical protein